MMSQGSENGVIKFSFVMITFVKKLNYKALNCC